MSLHDNNNKDDSHEKAEANADDDWCYYVLVSMDGGFRTCRLCTGGDVN